MTLVVALMACWILIDIKANAEDNTVVEKQIFPTMLTEYPDSAFDTDNAAEGASMPFVYQNQDLFSGKTITKIGVPVQAVTGSGDENGIYISLYVVDKYTFREGKEVNPDDLGEPVKAYFEDLTSGTTEQGWTYATLATPIELGENQTLAIGKADDPIDWMYVTDLKNTNYQYWDNSGVNNGTEYGIVFDIYYQEEVQADTLTEALNGKKISILGDGISTFDGVTNADSLGYGTHNPWFTSSNAADYDLTSGVNDTWWAQVISNNNMTLLRNNSWYGTYVVDGHAADGETETPYQNSGMIRAEDLGDDTVSPNIIAVFLGANDIINGNTPGTFSVAEYVAAGTDITDSTVFADAYYVMAKRLLNSYPEAEIYLFTIMPNGSIDDGTDAWYENLNAYNEVIRGIAEYNDTDNLHLVDLSAGVDGEYMDEDNYIDYLGNGLSDDKATHPTRIGMDYICKVFEDKLEETWLGEQPEYVFEEYREEQDRDEDGNWIDVPTREGYVFAGWYTDETYTTAASSDAVEGNYVPKWVDRDVLTVQIQLRKNADSTQSGARVTYDTDKVDVRLTTSVDSLNYRSIGFEVIGNETKVYSTQKVYQELSAYKYTDETGTKQGYKANQIFCESSEYFATHVLTGADNDLDSHCAPDEDFGQTLTVTPRWITMDGTVVEGKTRAFEINDGVGYEAEIDALEGTNDASDHIWYKKFADTTDGTDAVAVANQATELETVEIGILRSISLSSGVTTTRNISIQNHAVKDVTITRETDLVMICNGTADTYPTLTIGKDDDDVPGIVIDAELSDSSTSTLPAIRNGVENAENNGNMVLHKNVTVKNAKRTMTSSYGAGGLDNYGTATVSATFMDCQGGKGGAVNSNGVSLTFNGYIKDCQALNGAGIFVNKASFAMTGGLIEDCVATTSGGGIYGNSDADIDFQGGTIQSCQAPNAGGMLIRNGTINGAIRGCHAVGSDGKGGGVYVDGIITMTGTVEHCTAYRGAGIYTNGKDITIPDGVLIQNCVASNQGGGIYAVSPAVVNMTGGIIRSCTAQENGGGIQTAKATISGGTIKDCKAVNGAGIRLNSGTISGGIITGCVATTNGGAVYAEGSAPSVEMTSGTITGCEAYAGAGVYVEHGINEGSYNGKSGAFTMSSGLILGCVARYSGGAIHGNEGTQVIFATGTIQSCNAAAGGGVFVQEINTEDTNNTIPGATFTMESGTIQDCMAIGTTGTGGGIYGGTKGTITFTGGKIYNCSAVDGGGVYVLTGTLSMTSGTIEQCTADNGGGVYASGEVTMEGTVQDCSAYNGGGVYTLGKVAMTGTVQDCTAYNGAGIYATSNAVVTMTEGKIYNCIAEQSGGGIYGDTNAYIYFDGGNIESCSSSLEAGYAGGIFLRQGRIKGTITNCEAYRGGAVCVRANGVVTMTGATISNCTASKNGGAFHLNEGSTFTMESGTISECRAANIGGAIHSGGSKKVTLTAGTIENCTSKVDNDGMYCIVQLSLCTDVSVLELGSDFNMDCTTQKQCIRFWGATEREDKALVLPEGGLSNYSSENKLYITVEWATGDWVVVESEEIEYHFSLPEETDSDEL